MTKNRVALTSLAALCLAGCSKQPEAVPAATPRPTALVDTARITSPADGEWLSYGRTYDEQRYSPLAKIHEGMALLKKGEAAKVILYP